MQTSLQRTNTDTNTTALSRTIAPELRQRPPVASNAEFAADTTVTTKPIQQEWVRSNVGRFLLACGLRRTSNITRDLVQSYKCIAFAVSRRTPKR